MSTHFSRTVILGAGAMGSSTAYHLARRGEPFLLIEQFAIGHDRGSSHGSGRITRHSYADPAYARLMIDAFRAWRQLEAESGRTLYLRTGGVSICPEGVDYCDQVAASLASIDVPHRRMTGCDWNRCSPEFGLEPTDDVVFEPDAGILLAHRAIAAQWELARSLGGDGSQILEGKGVRRIDLEGSRPRLILDDRVIETDRLVVTAGSWTARLLPSFPIPLRPTRQQVLYFRPEDATAFISDKFPVFIFVGPSAEQAYYGMPGHLGMGVKVARHGGKDVDPDQVDRAIEPEYVDEIRGFLKRTVPGLAESRIDRSEVCLYTIADQERFRMGALPGRDDVIVASPCSGHGFKFSCLIGQILADLAVEGGTSIDIGAWTMDLPDQKTPAPGSVI